MGKWSKLTSIFQMGWNRHENLDVPQRLIMGSNPAVPCLAGAVEMTGVTGTLLNQASVDLLDSFDVFWQQVVRFGDVPISACRYLWIEMRRYVELEMAKPKSSASFHLLRLHQRWHKHLHLRPKASPSRDALRGFAKPSPSFFSEDPFLNLNDLKISSSNKYTTWEEKRKLKQSRKKKKKRHGQISGPTNWQFQIGYLQVQLVGDLRMGMVRWKLFGFDCTRKTWAWWGSWCNALLESMIAFLSKTSHYTFRITCTSYNVYIYIYIYIHNVWNKAHHSINLTSTISFTNDFRIFSLCFRHVFVVMVLRPSQVPNWGCVGWITVNVTFPISIGRVQISPFFPPITVYKFV